MPRKPSFDTPNGAVPSLRRRRKRRFAAPPAACSASVASPFAIVGLTSNQPIMPLPSGNSNERFLTSSA